MKKIISICLVLLFVFSLFEVSAFALNSSLKENDSVVVEQKLICDADLDDDFEDDSVIVVINNLKSKELKLHTTGDFSEVSPVLVEDLTSRTARKIEKKRRGYDVRVNKNVDASTEGEVCVEEEKFHQIIKLDLGVKSKLNVLQCIKKLEQREDV